LDSSTLPALRPTVAVADAIAALLREKGMERLKRGAAIWDGTEEDTWWKDYHDNYRTAQAEGFSSVDGSVTAIQRGTRVRTRGSGERYNPEAFAELSDPDLQSCTVEFGALYSGVTSLVVEFVPWETTVRLEIASWEREELGPPLTIEEIESVLLASAEPWETTAAQQHPLPFKVFIGHGGDHQWRELRDLFRDHHNFTTDAFEQVPRTGAVIRDILEGMIRSSAAGVLVLTQADQQADGTWHGRQNVVHEIGYVQAALGWDRAIIVVEEGVTLPTNLDGTQQVRFDRGRIRQAEGGVVAALRVLTERRVGICP
jgi:hypothetical protein